MKKNNLTLRRDFLKSAAAAAMGSAALAISGCNNTLSASRAKKSSVIEKNLRLKQKTIKQHRQAG